MKTCKDCKFYENECESHSQQKSMGNQPSLELCEIFYPKQRLIDANVLSEKIGQMKNEITHNRGGYRYCSEDEKNEWDKLDSFDSLVCDAPTVDAVEVIHCKDCKYWNDGIHWCDQHSHFDEDQWNMFDPDDFCSYGERKE